MARIALLSCALGFSLSACNTSEVLSTNDIAISSYGAPSFRDADPANIKGRKPHTYSIHGVDVSKYNKRVDWHKAKKAGVAFAFIKATEGKDDSDPFFKAHWRGAVKAGIPRSAYHFYYFCATPQAQARNYIRRVPKKWSSLPPVLDVEWNPKSPTCRKRPKPRKVVRDLKKFLDIVERHYGQKPIIYTTVDFHRDNLSDGSLPGYQYWLRSVTAQPVHKYGKRPWKFWQYSGTGLAPGFEGEVDLNVYHGSKNQWKKWLAKHSR